MPSKIYMAPEPSTTWTDTGGDKLLDIGGQAAAAVDVGAYLDLGAGDRADEYEWSLFIDGFDTAPVVGETVDLYFTQSSGTTGFDGQLTADPTASAEGTSAVNQLKNMLYAGSASVHSTTAGDNLQARGVVRLTSRFIAPVVHNNTADALLSTSDAHKVVLTPIPYESQ